jgi:hypothetical protein
MCVSARREKRDVSPWVFRRENAYGRDHGPLAHKKGIENEQAFEAMWRQMKIEPNTGLYREILTQPVEAEDAKFNTFSITDNAYTTHINIGIWKDLASFDAAVGKYIQPLKGVSH